MLEVHLHQLREGIEPGDAVVDLEERAAARLQNAPAFVHQPCIVRRVLDDAVSEHVVEGAVGKRQILTVGDEQVRVQVLVA